VGRLQQSASRNLRTSIANITIFFAVASAVMIFTGEVTPATLPPMAIAVLGGALGASTYVVQQQPLARYLLIGSVTLGALGLAGVLIATQVAA
jgi:hypothetical protein